MKIDIKKKKCSEVDTAIFHCVHIVAGEGSWVLGSTRTSCETKQMNEALQHFLINYLEAASA